MAYSLSLEQLAPPPSGIFLIYRLHVMKFRGGFWGFPEKKTRERIFSLEDFCPKGYCVREIQSGSRIKMCESCVFVRLSGWCALLHNVLLKSVIFEFLRPYFKCKIRETVRVFKIWHTQCGFSHTIALRATLSCRCNLVEGFCGFRGFL